MWWVEKLGPNVSTAVPSPAQPEGKNGRVPLAPAERGTPRPGAQKAAPPPQAAAKPAPQPAAKAAPPPKEPEPAKKKKGWF